MPDDNSESIWQKAARLLLHLHLSSLYDPSQQGGWMPGQFGTGNNMPPVNPLAAIFGQGQGQGQGQMQNNPLSNIFSPMSGNRGISMGNPATKLLPAGLANIYNSVISSYLNDSE